MRLIVEESRDLSAERKRDLLKGIRKLDEAAQAGQ
jgi:hypothetical protein